MGRRAGRRHRCGGVCTFTHDRMADGLALKLGLTGRQAQPIPSRTPALPLCSIIVCYRTLASSQVPGEADRFSPAAQPSSKIRSSGRRCLAFAGGALLDTERSSRNEVDPGFQAWCEGRLHGIPAERRATKVSLFLTAFLAPHRVKASATPDQDFDPRHPRSRSDDRQQGGLFVGSLRARGSSRQKSPSSPASRSDLQPGASREGEALLPAHLRACPGLPRPGPHRPLRVNSAGGKRRRSARTGCWTLSRARARCLR